CRSGPAHRPARDRPARVAPGGSSGRAHSRRAAAGCRAGRVPAGCGARARAACNRVLPSGPGSDWRRRPASVPVAESGRGSARSRGREERRTSLPGAAGRGGSASTIPFSFSVSRRLTPTAGPRLSCAAHGKFTRGDQGGLDLANDRSYIHFMSKGRKTRSAILSEALSAVSTEGFQGISIGMLADRLKMSKSGVFAHFGSKEELEKAVLEEAGQRLMAPVWSPAKACPRGRPGIEAICRKWMDWRLHTGGMPGGCVFMELSAEVDEKPGPVRDQLSEMQARWQATLARSAQIAIEEGHFRPDLDPRQFAYEMQGILMALKYYRRLLRDEKAVERSQQAFADLLARSSSGTD